LEDPSLIEPTYNQLVTDEFVESTIDTAIIGSIDPLNPSSLGFFINDNKALRGTLPTTNVTAIAEIKVINEKNKCQIAFNYYEYDLDTDILNPVPIATTGFSARFDNDATFNEIIVTGILPENTWVTDNLSSNKVLVIELLAIKEKADKDPALQFRVGGVTPSRSTLNLPVSSVSHDTLAGVVGTGASNKSGHIDFEEQTIYGKKTFIDELEVSTQGEGLIVTTPDGAKRYRISVDNSGAIITTLIP